MYRVKQFFGGSLTLRDDNGQAVQAMTMVRALNKMTKAGCLKACILPEKIISCGEIYPKSDLFNKAERVLSGRLRPFFLTGLTFINLEILIWARSPAHKCVAARKALFYREESINPVLRINSQPLYRAFSSSRAAGGK